MAGLAGCGLPMGRGVLIQHPSRQVTADSAKEPGGLQISVAANSIEAPTGLDPSGNARMQNGAMSDVDEEALKKWDPMTDDYNDTKFNSYDKGPGRNLPPDRQAPRFNRSPVSGTNAIKLYVAGIPDDLTEAGLTNLFSRAGKVLNVVKMRSKTPGTGTTFGFVSLSSVREANEAIRLFDKQRVGSHFLRVQLALSKEEKEKREREKQDNEDFVNSLPSNCKKEWVEIKKQPPLDVDQLNAGPTATNGVERVSSGYASSESGPESKQYIRTADPKSAAKKPANLITLPCMVCQKPSKKRCLICKSPYCSRDCQKKDWHTHRLSCIPQEQFQSDFENRFEITVDNNTLNTPCPELIGDQVTSPRPATRRPKMTDYETETLLPEKQTQVVLTHLNNPNDFHVVLVEKLQNELTTMLAQINQDCQTISNTGSGSYMPVEGELCLAQFTQDSTWYRCVVRRINLDGTVAVTYMDFGNGEELSASRLYRCKPEFLNLKLQGIRCSLSGVAMPPGGWSAEAMEGIRSKLRPDGQYLATCYNMDKGKANVEIIDPIDNSNVNMVLISNGWASKHEEDSADGVGARLMSPSRAPCKIVNEHQLPTMASRLSVGQEIQVTVVEVESPSEFWVQLLEESSAVKLEELQREVHQDYSVRPPQTGYQPTKFNMVAAKFHVDNVWYRGQVMTFDTQKALVRFLDFGNSALVSFDCLHHLDSNYWHLPFLAMCCSLAGMVESVGENWTEETCKFFKGMVLDQAFSGRVVETNDWGVLLSDLLLPSGDSVNQLLVARKMARRVVGGSGDASSVAIEKQVQGIPPTVKQLTDIPKTNQPVTPEPEQTPVTHRSAAAASMPFHKAPHVSDLHVTQLPKDTSDLLVIPTDASSPQRISIQLTSMANNDIEQLAQALQKTYAGYTGSHKPTKPGELVAAKYDLDKFWYRAVVECLEPQSATVSFLDYGNVEEVLYSAVAPLKEEFLQYPVQAVTCSLEAVLGDGKEWKPEFMGLFQLAKLQVIQADGLVPVIDLMHHETGQSYTMDLINADILQPSSPVTSHEHKPTEQPPTSPSGSVTPTEAVIVMNMPNLLTLPQQGNAAISVCPTDAPSPGVVSVQLVSMKEEINRLLQLLNDIYTGYTGSYVPKAVGEIVAARFVDGTFYRGAVKEIKHDSAGIHFIDFGNFDDVTYSNLAPLKPELGDYPQQAITCCLEPGLADGQTWNPTLLPIGAEVQLVVLGKRNGLSVIDLKDPSGVSYTELLISEGILKKPIGTPTPATPIKDTYSIPASTPVKTINPSPTAAAKSPAAKITSPAAKITSPAAKIASPAAATPSIGVASPSADVSRPRPGPMLGDLPLTGLPVSTSPVTVNPVDASAPDCISVQPMAMNEEIAGLFQALQTTYANHNGRHLPMKPGEVVAAKFSLDQFWYRAVVNKILGDTFQVRFVDYGNVDTVQADSLAVLQPEFLQYPVQAVCCALLDVVLKDGACWSPACIPQMQPVNMIVLGHREEVAMVDLLDYETGQSVTESLIIQGILCTPPARQPTVRSLAQLPPPVLPELNTRTICMVTEAQGIDSFYVQTKSQVDAVMNVQAALAQLYTGYQSTYRPEKTQELVAAVFPTDGGWYRAVVKDISGDLITVQYVDYGNEAIVSPALVAPLDDTLMEHPIQVLHCHLHGVQFSPGKQWNSTMMPTFQQMFVILKGQTDNRIAVDLLDEKGQSLTEILCHDNILSVVTAVESARSPAKAESLEPVQSDAALHATPKESLPQLSVPCQSEPVVVVVQEAPGPELFWLQACLPNVSETLSEVTMKLQETYATHTIMPYDCKDAQLVAAKFSQDNQWYRAEVLQRSAKGIHVRFLDFGNCDCVSLECVAELTTQLRQYPQLALCCSLPGVTPHDSHPWDPSYLAINQPLQAVFLALKDGVYEIDLVDPQTNESLLESLVAKGFLTALPATPKSSPSPKTKSVPQASSPTASLTPIHPPSNLDLPVQTLRVKNPLVYPWTVIDPSCFYVQWLEPDLSAKVGEQQIQLKEQGPKFHPLQAPSVGMLAVGLNARDNLYYRVQILEVTGKEAKVVFMDFGDVAMVPRDQLREIKSSFLDIPKQAIPCGISNLCGCGPDGSYTDAAKAWFVDAVCDTRMNLHGATLNNSRYMVDDLVPIVRSGPTSSLIDSMIAAGHATRPSRAAPARSSGFRLDALPTKVLPARFRAAVSWAKSPHDFFLQVESPEITEEARTRIAINEYCSQTPQLAEFKPEVGEICCARFKADGEWYRACVDKKRSKDDMRRVLFIDFGNTQPCSLNVLRPFKPEFTQVPAQAVWCGLDGIDNPTEALTEKFQQLVNDQTLEGTLVRENDVQKIVKLCFANGNSVSDLLMPHPTTPVPRTSPRQVAISPPSSSMPSPRLTPVQPSADIDPAQLSRQNAELMKQVEELRREVERMKMQKK